MNYLKIQRHLLKCIMKGNNKFLIGEYKDNIAVSNGGGVWLIPKLMFLLDIERLKKISTKKMDIAKLLEYDESCYEDAVCNTATNSIHNSVCVNIKSENKEEWVDMALLKYFDKPQFKVKVSGNFSPLMVFEEGVIAGVVAPTRFGGNSN